jgi:tRNA(Ile)-lysidine synthase
MLTRDLIDQLRQTKNLLAFSGGADSTALFHLLLDAGIAFDIAHVNYHTRTQSDAEAQSAHALAERHSLQCYLYEAVVDDANFEHEARHARYAFFEGLIEEHGYTCLITAHQLDDRLEWLLMQLGKGAGLPELLGMQLVEKRDGYTLVRPLLKLTKAELVAYLEEHAIGWFEDTSNDDERFKRNHFRHQYARPLLERFSNGIKKSFEYLDEDMEHLLDDVVVEQCEELFYFACPESKRTTLYTIDKVLKRNGFLMRQGDRERLKEESCVVVGRRYVVWVSDAYTFIAPRIEEEMEKAFKERCRQLRIEPKLRPYLYSEPEVFACIEALLSDDAGFSSARP